MMSSRDDTDRLSVATLKRNPKMELSRSDLLRLLSILEGELQAREIVIAVLKAEQVKKLLWPNPSVSGSQSAVDPWNALSRDAFGAYDPAFDRTTTVALFGLKMTQLEAMIERQRRARHSLTQQLTAIEDKYRQIVGQWEAERQQKATNGNVETKSSDGEAKAIAQTLESERQREKQIVMCLLSERKQLIVKLIEERQKNDELLHCLSAEKAKSAEMVEGLEDESKRSLQMEAELEKHLTDFDKERHSFKTQLAASEARNAELAAEVDRLRQQLSAKPNAVSLGEGVRSAIVTMTSSTRCVQTLPSVSTVSQPRASVAQHVSQHSYATVQPLSATKLNATIPPPPSVPAPPPKALVNNGKSRAPAKAFQNITYNLEAVGSDVTDSSKAHETTPSVSPSANHSSTKVAAQPVASAAAAPQTVQRKLSAGAVGRGTPPPIPPNKPVIKPVLPPQALQQQRKDLKAKTGAVAVNSTTNATLPSNSIKNTAINSSDSTGEPKDSADTTSVDVLCEELENFNSLLVAMVSTASQNNS